MWPHTHITIVIATIFSQSQHTFANHRQCQGLRFTLSHGTLDMLMQLKILLQHRNSDLYIMTYSRRYIWWSTVKIWLSFGEWTSELVKDWAQVIDCLSRTESVGGSWKSNVHTFNKTLSSPPLLVSQEGTLYYSHELKRMVDAAMQRSPALPSFLCMHYGASRMHHVENARWRRVWHACKVTTAGTGLAIFPHDQRYSKGIV